jgi:hypothetical protein
MRLYHTHRNYSTANWTIVFLAALVLLFSPNTSPAQKGVYRGTEITPFGGFQFGGSTDGREGTLDITDSFNFGLTVDIPIAKRSYIELLYGHQPSELTLREEDVFATKNTVSDLNVNYYHLGGRQELKTGDVNLFFNWLMGITHYAPKDSEFDNEWRFSMSAGIGLKHMFSDKFGVRFQGRLYFTFLDAGAYFFDSDNRQFYKFAGFHLLPQQDLTIGFIYQL